MRIVIRIWSLRVDLCRRSSKISLLLSLISIALFSISVYSFERAIYSYTIEYLAPSGDDVASHALLIRMFKENIPVFFGRMADATKQYPSLFHVILGVLSVISGKDAFFIPKMLGMFMFIVVILGLALWLILFKRIWGSWPVAVLTLSALLVLSPRLQQTVGDGSYPYVLTVFMVLPLILLLIRDRHIFLGGIMLGFAASNSYGGFITLLIYVIPLIISVLIQIRSARSFLLLTAGFLTGGLLFVYKAVMHLVPLFLANKPLVGEGVGFSLLQYSWYMFCGNEWVFYVVTIVAASLLISSLLKRELERIWISAGYTSLLALAIFGPAILQIRILRDLAWISSLIIGDLSYKLVALLKEHMDKTTAMLLVTIFLLVPLHIVFQAQIQDAHKGGLVRLDEQRLATYIFLENYLVENGYRNLTMYVVAEVSSWAPFYITDWSRNISEFRLQPFSSLKHASPNDPYVDEARHALTTILNDGILESNKICFLLVETPMKYIWYSEGVRELADRLLLIYGSSDREGGVIFKVEMDGYKAIIYRIA